MSAVAYQIKLYNPTSGQLRALFVGRGRYGPGSVNTGELVNFNFWKRLRTPGSFLITVKGDDERLAEFVDDAMVVIERRDILEGGPFVKVYEGFHRDFNYSMDASGARVFVSRGRGFNDLLASDIILATAGSAGAAKTGATETVAKAYVNENIGPGAGVDALGYTRVRPLLTVEADTAKGANWTGNRAYFNLLDVLIELAEYNAGGFDKSEFGLIGTVPPAMQFSWRYGSWGLDSRRGNTAGNPPVIFSTLRNNIEGIDVSESRLNEANVCLTIGQGVGAIRPSRTRVNATSLGASPYARRVVARESSEATNALLDDSGDRTLGELAPQTGINFGVLQSTGTRWVRDWDVGSLVTVENLGVFYDQKIIGVRVSLSESGEETISVESLNV